MVDSCSTAVDYACDSVLACDDDLDVGNCDLRDANSRDLNEFHDDFLLHVVHDDIGMCDFPDDHFSVPRVHLSQIQGLFLDFFGV